MHSERRVLTRTALLLYGLLLCAPPPTSAQTTCSNTDIGTITTNTQLASLNQPAGCTIIADDLVVGTRDCSLQCDVTSFSALDSVTEIQGSLVIQCCSALEEIGGFSSLLQITRSLVVYYNQNLRSISGFGALQTVTNIEISQNMILQAVSGLGNLPTIQGYLQIDGNVALSDLDGLQSLQTIQGDELVAGHALNVLYNTNLNSLRGFRSLSTISYGTVHIEGNTNLCFAGYPQWNVGSYPPRLPSGSGDVGIDWRTRLATGVPDWQYTWGVAGFPTLVVQNNAARSDCTSASCDPSCPEGAGCLGPSNSALCGSCLQNGNLDTCLIGPTPDDESCDSTPIPYSVAAGFFFLFIALIALVLIAVLILVGIKVYKRFKIGRKGGFDINLSSSESRDSEVGLVPMEEYKPSRSSKSRTTGMIAEAASETETDGGKQESGGVVMSSYKARTDDLDTSPQSYTAGTIAEVASETESDSKKRGRKSKPGGVVLSNYRVKTEDTDSSLLQSRTTGTVAEAAAKRETDGKKRGAKSKPGGVVLSSYRVQTEDSETIPQSGITAEAVTETEAVGKKQEAKSKTGGVMLSSYKVRADDSETVPQSGITASTEVGKKQGAKSKTGGVVLSSYRVRTDDSDTGLSQDLTPQVAAGAATVSAETAAKPVGPTALHRQSKQAPAKPLPYRVPKRQSKSEPVLTASYKKADSSSLAAPGTREQTAPASAAAATSSSAGKASVGGGRGVSRGDTLTRLRGDSSDIPMRFPQEQVKLVKEFGRASFGKVYQADAKRLIPGQKKTAVVVKQLKDGATQEERETFLHPVEAMKVLKHPNTLSLMGVCSQGPTIMVLLEYCSHGNLKTFLVRKRREAAAIKERGLLLRMACEMAAGLMYLHSKNIAHNDFAVRNCLVSGDSSVKVGDYGLSRQTFKEDYYCRGPNQKAWPIRWMAPEQIVVQGRSVLDSMLASMAGNIWSFGISLWEVCSFAQWPYEEMSNEEVIQSLKSTGKCQLENPLKSSEPLASLYDIMQLCWEEPEQRPTIKEVYNQMQELEGQLERGEKPVRPVQHQHPSGSSKRPSSNQKVEQKTPATSPQKKPAEPVKPDEQEPPARRTSGQYKPRRPAPKKPPQRKRPSTSTEPLITQSLSQEEEPFDDRSPSASSYSTTSLGRSPKKTDAQQLPLERSVSADLAAPKSGSLSFEQDEMGRGALNPLFDKEPRERASKSEEEHGGAAGPRRDQYSFQHEADIESSSPVEVNLDAVMEAAKMDSLVGEFGADDMENGFILEPPEEFSQPDFSQSSGDRELHAPGGSAKFFIPSDNAVRYSFGPDSEDDDDDEIYPVDISGRRLGGAKEPTGAPPTASAKPRDEYMFDDDFGTPDDNDDNNEGDYPRQVVSNPPPWIMDDGQFEMGFERDALEEDDLPTVMLGDEEAALIW